MHRIDRADLLYQLHSLLHFSKKRVPGARGLAEVADRRAVDDLLNRVLDIVYAKGAVLVRPDPVHLRVTTSELAFSNHLFRDGVFGEDEPHPCPDAQPFLPPASINPYEVKAFDWSKLTAAGVGDRSGGQSEAAMTIDTILAGNWSLIVEEAAYDPESTTVISFHDGMVSDEDGQIGAYRIEGNTVFAPLGENVELEVNPGNHETDAAAPAIEDGAVSLIANLRTSFTDGSDDLVEYATLQRQP